VGRSDEGTLGEVRVNLGLTLPAVEDEISDLSPLEGTKERGAGRHWTSAGIDE